MTKKKFSLSLRAKEILSGYLFILPWMIGFIIFFFVNYIQTIRFSFNTINLIPSEGYTLSFVGFDNFVNAFTKHATYNRQLVESITGMLVDVPLIIFFSLFIALLLNKKFKLRGLVRAIFFLPVIMASGAITSAMEASLKMIMGGISSVPPEMQTTEGLDVFAIMMTLSDFGLPLDLIQYIIGAVERVYDIVKSSGVQILIFLAALQSVPASLYEVAHIEGATSYETFWKITFPIVSPLILTNVVYTIVDRYTQSSIVSLAYDTAFKNMNFGLSAAMSMISSISTLLILLLVGLGISRYTFYQN